MSFNKFIFVRSEYDNIKIDIDEIRYIKGLKDYLKIHVSYSYNSILTLLTFDKMIAKLPSDQFLRVHKSYIVNIAKIKSVQKSKITLDGKIIPIGATYKDVVLKKLGLD